VDDCAHVRTARRRYVVFGVVELATKPHDRYATCDFVDEGDGVRVCNATFVGWDATQVGMLESSIACRVMGLWLWGQW